MRCIAIREFGGPDRLEMIDLPRPRPGKNELLLRVVSAGISRIDSRIRAGAEAEELPHGFPLIPGWDVAGVVEELGENATAFRKGDRVWACARKPTQQWGCYAEFVAVPESFTALMPSKLLFEEAAAYPTAALGAYQGLFHGGNLEAGQRVLIHGAAGGVGHLAVQLARNAGAEVIGTTRPTGRGMVLELGAGGLIDSSRDDWVAEARHAGRDGYDLVLDLVGGGLLEGSYELVRPGGRLVSLTQPPDGDRARELGISAARISVEPDAERLSLLARQIDQRKLRVYIHKMFRLKQAAVAHETLDAGGVLGKLILNI